MKRWHTSDPWATRMSHLPASSPHPAFALQRRILTLLLCLVMRGDSLVSSLFSCPYLLSGNRGQDVGCVWVADGFVFQPIQPVHRCLIPAWHEMPVGVHGDLDATVPHLLFDVGQRLAVLDQEAGEGMPQVVHADIPQARFCQELAPDTHVKVCLVAGLALLVGEDPRRDFPPALA